MAKKKDVKNLSCTDCSIYNCRSKSKEFPG
ncbi:MAG: hypothetical protein H6Q72_4933, partial [Firmicutes bacterium]|nr:hypothetical protein [Bacillota bacterium]